MAAMRWNIFLERENSVKHFSFIISVGTTPKEIYEEMKMVNDYNTRCRNKFLRIEIGIAPKDEPR